MQRHLAFVGALAMLSAIPAGAQPISAEDARDQAFGWTKIYHFPPATAPVTVDHRVYTVSQLSTAAMLANWMQQSYAPVGGLGDIRRAVSDKLTPYNQETTSLPQAYGARASIYTELKYGAGRKIEPASNSRVLWTIFANGVIGEPALALSTPQQYYFTLPSFTDQGYHDNDLEKAVDLSSHPLLGRYPAYFVRNSVSGNEKVLVLSRDNRLPFVKLTRAEYLDAVDAAIAHWYESERRRISEAEQGNQARIARAMVDVDDRRQKRLAALAVNRERYKARLQEVAEIAEATPSISLENMADAFLGTGGSPLRLPVYKVDPALAALTKTGGPQWLVVAWTAQLNDPASKRLHDAVVNNFNFAFVHDYFFAPEKVKGRTYAPLRNPAATETVAPVAASAASTARAADPGVYFFDDFSTTPVGKAPIGWKSSLSNTGASSVVAELPGMPGHWMATTGFTLKPAQLKAPLPADFTVTYDLVASADYTWGSRGATFTLSKGSERDRLGPSLISLSLRPGSGSADGEGSIEGRFPEAPASLNNVKFFKVPGFSNKAQSTVAVTLVKQGERVQVLLNKQKVFELDKAVPAGLLFDGLSVNQGGSFNATDRMFIGNVTIRKN
jgi:hypothetical protein